MIRTPKSFCRLSLIVRKYPPALKTSPCMNLSTALQGKSMYWFSHGTRISEKQLLIWQVIFATTSILAYNSGVKLLLVFRWNTTCIFLLLSCTTDGSLEFDTRYQHFCFVLLVSRFYRKVRCLFFFLFSEEFWCFIYRDLNLVSLMPYYILFLSFSVVDVIFTLYKTLLLRNLLFRTYFNFFIQLYALAWADGCRFVTVILCMLIWEANG